jgi:hypothetical protein
MTTLKTTFAVQFTLFGSNQMQSGTFTAKSQEAIFAFINKTYGAVDYFNAIEF